MSRRQHSTVREVPMDATREARLSEQKEFLTAALSSLSPRDQEILQRYYLSEQTPDEICKEMGITETQLRLLKSSAKARFMAGLKNREGEVAGRKAATKSGAFRATAGESVVIGIDRVVAVVAHAVAVFGDEQKASNWLKAPLAILGGRSPSQTMARKGGFKTVDQVLTRIEHNIPS